MLFLIVILGATALAFPLLQHAYISVTLPLRHEDVIRQQAARHNVSPFLIAGVIYVESHFRDQTSDAGAKGLMQIMPSTADYIARKSGGTSFVEGDLASPQINIAYGSFYLRYLLNNYRGNRLLAISAYNAGEGKVDEWITEARNRGERFHRPDRIPFAETREYVERVFAAEQRYRKQYHEELSGH